MPISLPIFSLIKRMFPFHCGALFWLPILKFCSVLMQRLSYIQSVNIKGKQKYNINVQ